MLTLIATLSLLGTGNTDVENIAFFEKNIRPVLIEHCYECHSGKAKILKGGLRLDHREGLLAGGNSGAAIVPGDPEASRLVHALRYKDPDLRMPPSGRLPDPVVTNFVEWIRSGAVDPRQEAPTASARKTIDLGKARDFWAFRPSMDQRPPQVEDPSWVHSPIDHFILARLESGGLKPASPIDQRRLLRRVTFDLVGLPPTQAETAAFLADRRPDAFARVIDRLLASPRYGEKWGRHWLDIVRYADSNGMDENMAFVNAYRYRDWVIEALNKDKPYDRFVQEQVAGDLLVSETTRDDERMRLLTATGFLSVGPKMIACDDGRKMEMDIIDEQISTLGQSVLGLTIACARCHDHKYDPISSADYYSLAGIFKSTQTMNNFNVVARWHEWELLNDEDQKRVDKYRSDLATTEKTLQEAVKSEAEKLLPSARARAGEYLLAAFEIFRGRDEVPVDGGVGVGELLDSAGFERSTLIVEAEDYARGTLTRDTTSYGRGIGVLLHQGFAEYDFTIEKAGRYQLETRHASEEERPMRLFVDGVLTSELVAKERTGGWGPDEQSWFRVGTLHLGPGKHTLRLERTDGPVPHIDKWMLLPVREDSKGLRSGFIVQWLDYLRAMEKTPSDLWRRGDVAETVHEAIVRENSKRFDEAESAWAKALELDPEVPALSDAKLEAYREVLHDEERGPFALGEDPERFFATAARSNVERLRVRLNTLKQDPPDIPRAMGVREGKPENLRVHLRGDYLTLGEETTRRFPSVFGDEEPAIIEGSSGRLELARWMTSPDQPLFARVIVNRVWLWHFGDGLVRTPDNFGELGERPTHPKLLDWLARRLVASGWSLKELHRTLLLSATYRMGSTYDEHAYARDPDNRLWWRFPRRRLNVEELRDSLLSLADNLDLTMYGQLMRAAPRQYVATFNQSSTETAETPRRSVYLPVVRSGTFPIYQIFDFPDPSVPLGRRASTTIAPQALFLMNSKLVLGEASRLVELGMKTPDVNPEERVAWFYGRILGREPDAAEMDSALSFVENSELLLADEARERASSGSAPDDATDLRLLAFRSLCRTLMASNEFLYVD